MIDNQDQVERLLRNLTEVLPLSARATSALMADLCERPSAAKITWDCKVINVFYTGDEGGVTCHVIFDEKEKQQVFLVSITHLVFDRRLPICARDSRLPETSHQAYSPREHDPRACRLSLKAQTTHLVLLGLRSLSPSRPRGNGLKPRIADVTTTTKIGTAASITGTSLSRDQRAVSV